MTGNLCDGKESDDTLPPVRQIVPPLPDGADHHALQSLMLKASKQVQSKLETCKMPAVGLERSEKSGQSLGVEVYVGHCTKPLHVLCGSGLWNEPRPSGAPTSCPIGRLFLTGRGDSKSFRGRSAV